MYTLLVVVCLGLLSAQLVDAGNGEKVGNVTTDASSTSGEVSIARRKHKIKCRIEEMSEVDGSLDEVGSNRPGHKKHKVVGFATRHFNKSAAEDTTYKNISCRKFTLSTTVQGPNATVVIEVYIFKENGTFSIANDAEDYSVKRGTVKLNVNIKNWRFCGKAAGEDNQCKNGSTVQEGKYILVGFSVQGKDGKAPKEKPKAPGRKGRKKKAYEIDGGECIVSGEVQVDGIWTGMDGDFPKLVPHENKQMFRFSFPKFNRSVHYDPVIEMGDDLASTPSEPPSATPSNSSSTTPSKPPSTTPSKAWKTTTHFSMLLISLVVLFAKCVV